MKLRATAWLLALTALGCIVWLASTRGSAGNPDESGASAPVMDGLPQRASPVLERSGDAPEAPSVRRSSVGQAITFLTTTSSGVRVPQCRVLASPPGRRLSRGSSLELGRTTSDGTLTLGRGGLLRTLGGMDADCYIHAIQEDLGLSACGPRMHFSELSSLDIVRIELRPVAQQVFRFEMLPGGTPFQGASVLMSRAALGDFEWKAGLGKTHSGVTVAAVHAATSDANGNAVLGAVPIGRYAVRLVLPWHLTSCRGPARWLVDVPSAPVVVPLREIWAAVVRCDVAKIVTYNARQRHVGTSGTNGLLAEARERLMREWPGCAVSVGYPRRLDARPSVEFDLLLEGRGWVAHRTPLVPLAALTAPDAMDGIRLPPPSAFGQFRLETLGGCSSAEVPAVELVAGQAVPPRMVLRVQPEVDYSLPVGEYSLLPRDSVLRRALGETLVTVREGKQTAARVGIPGGFGRLELRLIGPTGRLVRDVWLRVFGPTGELVLEKRIARPELEQIWVPRGELSVRVAARGYAERVRIVHVSNALHVMEFVLPWES